MPVPIIGAAAVGFVGGRTARRLIDRHRENVDRRERVRDMVLDTLRDESGNSKLDWDEDGELSVATGSAIAWISVIGTRELPAVLLRSVLLTDVALDPALLARINEINIQLIFGTLVADGDDVCLSYSFVADKLTKDELLLSLDLFLDGADTWDTVLSSEFGGMTMKADGVDVFDA